MRRTVRVHLDSGILLAAWRLGGNVAERLRALLEDERYEIVTSRLVEMETIPKAVYHGQAVEAGFYRTILDYDTVWVEVDQD